MFIAQGSRRFAVALLAAVVLAAAAPAAADARTLVVDDDAGCADATFSSIQSALDAAVPGDQIAVCPGTYAESLVVSTERIKIFSRTRLAAVIQRPSGGRVVIQARGVLLRGFTITGDCGLESDGVEVFAGATIDYNRIVDGCGNLGRGVYTDPILGGTVSVANNEILGAAVGVRAATDVNVNSNLIEGGGTGVNFVGGVGVVQANTIEDNTGPGVVGDGFERDVFKLHLGGNRVQRNAVGIEVRNVGLGVGTPHNLRNVRVEGNGVFENAGDGIRIISSPGYIVRNRSLRNGGFDCFDDPAFGTAGWQDNVGVTDSPPTLCRAP